MLPCYHLARILYLREHKLVVRRLARDLLFVSLSPWPMYYQCKWSVQLFLIALFTSKCLRNEVIGSPSHPIRRGNISFQNNKWNIQEDNDIYEMCCGENWLTFLSGIPWSNSCLVRFLSMVFYPWLLPTKTKMCETQYPWSMNCRWCRFLLLFYSQLHGYN